MKYLYFLFVRFICLFKKNKKVQRKKRYKVKKGKKYENKKINMYLL